MKNIFFALALLLPCQAFAGQTAVGVPQSVGVNVNGGALVVFDQMTISGSAPSCGAAQAGQFYFDIRTDAGKAMLNIIVQAKLIGQSFKLMGSGACDFGGSYEGVNSVYLIQK